MATTPPTSAHAALACCGFCHNHVSLVNNVYPSAPGEDGPRGSALSLVIYYATSKPHKLPKIGAHLERRALADLRKYRYGYVRVTLQIIHALLSECRQNANLISKNILRIILEVLSAPDPDLVLQATSTFILFSAHHNHQNVIDAEFSDIYSRLIKKFCSEAVYETSDNTLQHKTRLSGLKALEAVCGSDSFMMSPHLLVYSQQIVPAILSNMGSSQKRQESVDMPTPGSYTKRPSLTDQLITDDELRNSAQICIRGLFSQANVTNLKEFLLYVLKFLDDRKLWASSNYVLDVIRSITDVVQSQYQYITLSLMLERLETETQPTTKTTVARILTYLISDAAGMGGLTVPELLETFVRHLRASTEIPSTSDPSLISAQAKLQQALIEAIGSLAHQLAYPNQINDILAFLVNRLMSDYDVAATCSLIVRAIDQVLATFVGRPTNKQTKRVSTIPASVSFDLVTPTLRLLEHSNPGVRLLYYPLLIKIVSHLPPKWEPQEESTDASLFVMALWRGLFDAALRDENNPADYVGSGLVMTQLLRQSMFDIVVYAVPVLFCLQDHIEDEPMSSASIQRALASLVLCCVDEMAGILNVADLIEYTNTIRQERLGSRQWSPGFELTNEALTSLGTRTFSETEAVDAGILASPVPTLLSRDRVIGYLVSDTRFKEIIDGESRIRSEELPWEEDEMPSTTIPVLYNNGSKSGSYADPLRQNASPDMTGIRQPLQRRASQRRGTSPVHGKQRSVRSTTSIKSDRPQTANIRIEDIKDALSPHPKSRTSPLATAINVGQGVTAGPNGKSTNVSDMDMDYVAVDSDESSRENMSSLLKSITATFGKSGQTSATTTPRRALSPLIETNAANSAVSPNAAVAVLDGSRNQINSKTTTSLSPRKQIENVELDWLTARSRDLSREPQPLSTPATPATTHGPASATTNMTRSRSFSQQNRRRNSESAQSTSGLRIKEPVMLGIDPIV